MSTSPLLSQATQDPAAGSSSARAYSLVVLVQASSGKTSARAANLAIPDVEASTVREALNLLIQDAKALIQKQLSTGREIPWVQPPDQATEAESQFLVPMHL